MAEETAKHREATPRSGLRRQLIKGSCVERAAAAAQLIPFSPPKGKLQRGAPPLKLLQLAALPASSATRSLPLPRTPTSALLLLLCLAIMTCPKREEGKQNKTRVSSVVAVVDSCEEDFLVRLSPCSRGKIDRLSKVTLCCT